MIKSTSANSILQTIIILCDEILMSKAKNMLIQWSLLRISASQYETNTIGEHTCCNKRAYSPVPNHGGGGLN